MARYSVATTKDKLSSLIDKALAGEEVIITRHGKDTVRLVAGAPELPQAPKKDVQAATRRLREQLAGKPTLNIPVHNFREWLYAEDEY